MTSLFLRSCCSLVTGLTALSMLALPQAFAAEQHITCGSINYGYNYCRIRTDGRARIAHQISHKPCINGDSWGYDNMGVWVDKGCRADFVVGSPYNQQYGGNPASNYGGGYGIAPVGGGYAPPPPPQPQQPIPSGNVAGIDIFPSMKRFGGDYTHFTVRDVPECAMACSRDFRCAAFNYGIQQRDCWLKNNVPPGVPNNTVISGVKR